MIKKLLNTKISKQNKKGFTLAELLIVVAIIGVLVAISIPIFTTQLEKSREATDLANIRSGYAEAMTKYMTDKSGEASGAVKQATASWQTSDHTLVTRVDGSESNVEIPALTIGDSWTLSISDNSGSPVVSIK